MSRSLIEKAQKLLTRETGAIIKPHGGRIRFALAFPGTYRVGMSSLGLQIIYGILNGLQGVVCERAFLPDAQDSKELERSRTRLFSVESQTPLDDFDVIAFSVSFELDYTNIVRILDLAGIPALSSERDQSYPLIIAGGPCPTFNPEPLADIIDAFAIGDGEEIATDIARAIEDSTGEDREALLARLAAIPGVYVPRFYTPIYAEDGTITGVTVTPPAPERVTRRITRDLDSQPNRTVVLSPDAEFSDMTLVEAMRGCMRQCRFCAAGYIGLPPRPRKISDLPHDARVGLVGSAVFDHPEALAICQGLSDDDREFSVSSIRIESLSSELAAMMIRAGQRTFTIAPEAGTERLRRIINKSTTDDEVLEAARIAIDAGAARLKLYFMVGLPGELDEDIEAIPALARSIASRHPGVRILLSVSCYVPKPATPFQWCGMADTKALSAKLARVKKLLSGERKIEFSSESAREAHIQGWLARGDRRLGEVIVKAARGESSYARAAQELDIDTSFFANRTRREDETLPWDHIDLGVNREYLRKEFTRALDGALTVPCRVGSCARCGVC